MSAVARAHSDAATRRKATTVLIVEDFSPLRELYKLFLADDPAIECVGTAANGREAVRLVHERQPDVVLLDISLPDSNGLTVAKRIKATSPQTHILVLGEDDGHDYHLAAKASGAGAYLRKEYTVDLLASVIHDLVAWPAAK